MQHSRRTTTLLPLLSVATFGMYGCGECGPWDELPIDATAIEEPDEPLARVQEGIDQFVAWTGREETCVRGVEIVEEIPVEDEEHGIAGQYDPATRIIEVESAWPRQTTTHELCHSLDHEDADGDEWASEAAWDLLAPYGIGMDPVLYPTERARVHEAFARFCDDGPQVFALLDQLHETCGVEGASEGARFVRDVAFPDYDAAIGWEELGEPFAYTTVETPLAETRREAASRGAVAVAGAAGPHVLDMSWVEDPTTGAWTIAPRLLLLDPTTLAVVDTLDLAQRDPAAPGEPTLQLFGSTGAPILYAASGDDAGAAWRVEADPLRLVPTPWPDTGGEIRTAFEHDGVAYVLPFGALLRVDLATGTAEPLAAEGDESLSFDPSYAAGLHADETGALVAYAAAGGLALVSFDWEGAPTDVRDLPIPTNRVLSLFRLPDGSFVATPVASSPPADDGTAASVPISVRHDPATDTWSAPDGNCAALAGEGWVTVGDAVMRVRAVEVEAGVFELEVVTLDP